jgi:large subunit ribosomal protein L28
VLNKPVKFRVSSRAIRTVEKKGGIDKFLADAFEKDLSASALYYKKLIKRKEATKA